MFASTGKISTTRPGSWLPQIGLVCFFLQFFVDADPRSTIREELASLVELLTDKETFDRSVSQEEPEEEDSMQVGNK